MKRTKLSEQKWFNGAIIACIGVGFYVLLSHFGSILAGFRSFIGYFTPVILGVVFAYVINPLAKHLYYRVFKMMKLGKVRWIVSVLLAFLLMLIILFLLLATLIPQLVQSLAMFSSNIDNYARSLIKMVENSSLSSMIDTSGLETITMNALASVTTMLSDNSDKILRIAASSGKNILVVTIGLILAVYLLLDVRRVMIGVRKFFSMMLPPRVYDVFLDFTLRCDTILVTYIVQSLFDALIVGTVNAIFMFICKMPYIGLVSVVVAVTNLIPNFGPIIGGVIGSFILLLVDPMQVLLFAGFTLVLQFVDGYIIKPRLFSNSLGVSGLLILTSTVVLGNMFGILGILLSIPTAAILSFIYNDYFVPWKMAHRNTEE